MTDLRLGIIGCGNISGQYLATLTGLPGVTPVACADLDPARAAATAAGHGLRALGADALLADPDVDAVVNLTVPSAHADVTREAIAAGKHVWSEKPLSLTREDAAAITAEAAAAGVRVGCAPDTILGAGLQTTARAVADGLIGRPVAATAFFATAGPELWHPDPEFFYAKGAGPLHDIGVYSLTALVAILGPVATVTAVTARGRDQRVIESGPKAGRTVPVEVATHYSLTLGMASGAVATIVTSFDVPGHHLPHLEVHGTDGSLTAPDPNRHDGHPSLRRRGEREWTELPHTGGYLGSRRGIGVHDLATALAQGRPHIASLELGAHVLDVMLTADEAAAAGRTLPVAGGCALPPPVPGLIGG
ncbi:oxidoreductase [Actinorhabdospora filicis]|uniref:Oxidoreductase n=1 Tax=Actinorhabdospora filicis TaxID=1785913 RepID=A0A9W6SLG9_9ACTN|nr:Gfo/Idh/MocA family oxidoreductase [Actinorhabdospora filicis]GLZ79135.1 oxidoreductase [Actinorhabdospora filicis]